MGLFQAHVQTFVCKAKLWPNVYSTMQRPIFIIVFIPVSPREKNSRKKFSCMNLNKCLNTVKSCNNILALLNKHEKAKDGRRYTCSLCFSMCFGEAVNCNHSRIALLENRVVN